MMSDTLGKRVSFKLILILSKTFLPFHKLRRVVRKLSDREGAQACRVVEQAAEDDEVVMMLVRLLLPMMLRMTKLWLSQNCE